MRFLILAGLFLVAAATLAVSSRADTSQSAPPPTSHAVEQPNHTDTEEQSNDVQPPRVTPEMQRYSRINYALYFVGAAYSLLVLWGVLASGLSARLRRFAERIGPKPFLAMLIYLALLTLVIIALETPISIYSGWYLERSYGLSQQSFGSWLEDAIKGHLVNFAVMAPVMLLLFALIKWSPRRWSLWFWAALVPLIAFGIFLSPVLIDPIFNKFTPMPASPLRTRIEALAEKAGLGNAPIYVVDKSKQTNTTNAYVTGLGSSARIVLWDTTINRMGKHPDQIESILAHEMGHYKLGHITRGFWEAVVLLIIGLPLAQKLIEWMVARFGTRWQLRGITDPAAIPVFYLTLTLLSFFAAPLTNALSRQIEHEADAYGLELTGNHVAMARAFVALSEQNLSDPNPPALIKFWLFSHPALQERIDFALGRKSGASR